MDEVSRCVPGTCSYLTEREKAQEAVTDTRECDDVVGQDAEPGPVTDCEDADPAQADFEDQMDAQSGEGSASERQLPSYMSLPPLPGTVMGADDNERPQELQRSASRLSRPTSAQIATQIEGYHDDFLEMPLLDQEDALQDALQGQVCAAGLQLW